MADMRDRLIELLKGAETKVTEQLSHPLELEEWLGIYADHLLENGVILPPCKVGDTVYIISRNRVKVCEVVYIGISVEETCSCFNFVENYADGTFYKSHSMGFDAIGKTVFLTREEAEKALREKEK